jgi:hypothetical protein
MRQQTRPLKEPAEKVVQDIRRRRASIIRPRRRSGSHTPDDEHWTRAVLEYLAMLACFSRLQRDSSEEFEAALARSRSPKVHRQHDIAGRC